MHSRLQSIFGQNNLLMDKVKQFTTEVCIPEVLRQEKLAKGQKGVQYLNTTRQSDINALPYVCLYNALSLIQRVPTEKELQAGFDISKGFNMKKDFVMFANDIKKKDCKQTLQQTYESEIDGRMLDGLLPNQDKYLGNKFMSVYSQFCKGNIKNKRQMYLNGLELQSKLEKIAAYDKCNQQKAASSMTSYCQTLFNRSESFAMWTDK